MLARRYQYPKVHSHHTAKLALSLFDQTQSIHGMGEVEREWLEYTALLHDIGHHIQENQHHKHTYYLITHADLPGFSLDEIRIIANVSRYHRRSLPKARHQGFKLLNAGQRKTVLGLSSILRIADGLDRTHFSVVKAVKAHLGKSLRLEVVFRYDPELELWTTERRKRLFEKLFHCSVELVPSAVTAKGAA